MRLKDWIVTGLQYAGAVILGSAIYGVLMGTSETEDFLTMTAIYMLLFGAGMGMVFNMSVYKVGLPAAIGFGSTRKEAFIGMQCYRLIFMVVLLGAAALLYLLSGKEAMAELRVFAPIGISLMLVLNAMGAVMGMISTRFGKTAVVILSVIAGLIISAVIAVTIILLTLYGDSLGGSSLLIFPAVSAVVYALIAIPEYKTIYKYNVKL